MAKNSKTIEITSSQQFNSLLQSSKAVVADFYADWCGPCKAIAPVYESFSETYSRQNLVTFTKINTDNQSDIAQRYQITAMPTFVYFENGKEHSRIQGGDRQRLTGLIDRWKTIGSGGGGGGEGSGGESSGGGAGGGTWVGNELPRGYKDVTDQIDIKGIEIRNNDSDFGNARTLIDGSQPSSLKKSGGKAPASASSSDSPGSKDWVESDTDPELMIHMPFQSTLKIHSLQLTSSAPPASSLQEDDDDVDDETPMRPKTIKLFINKPNIVGFDEDIEPTQEIVISEGDWNGATATLNLRYVKFQKVSTLCVFVVDGDREGGERTRIDRLRIIGESGEKREMGKLEKIGDEQGE